MKKRVYIALATLLAVACSAEESPEITSSEEMGRIGFTLQSESVIEATTTTRATEDDGDTNEEGEDTTDDGTTEDVIPEGSYILAEELIPTESDFDITIYTRSYDDDGVPVYELVEKYDSVEEYNTAEEDENDSSILTPPYLTAGEYTATITNKYDISEESATNACFAGGVDFTVVARKTDSESSIEATLQNSIIRMEVTDQFNEYFEGGATLTLTTEAGGELTLDFPIDEGATEQILFVAPETNLYLSGTAIKQDPGNGTQPEVTFVKSNVGVAITATMNTVIVDAEDVGQGSITITLNDSITKINTTSVDLNDGETTDDGEATDDGETMNTEE